jgi:hypothetical protein
MTSLRGWAPKGRATRRQGPAGQMEDRDFPRPFAQRPHRRALPVRRAHQRRALPRLCRTPPCPDAHAGRPRDPRPSLLSRGEGDAEGDPGCRSPRALCSCRNTAPTSTPLSRSSPSSRPCSERPGREPTKPSPAPAGPVPARRMRRTLQPGHEGQIRSPHRNRKAGKGRLDLNHAKARRPRKRPPEGQSPLDAKNRLINTAPARTAGRARGDVVVWSLC